MKKLFIVYTISVFFKDDYSYEVLQEDSIFETEIEALRYIDQCLHSSNVGIRNRDYTILTVYRN